MKLVLTERAADGLARMPRKAAVDLLARLEAIAASPFATHSNVKRLSGVEGWRLRKGDWRAVYLLDRAADEMTVTLIEHRSSAYRKLNRR